MGGTFRSLSAGVMVMGLAVAGCAGDDAGPAPENLGKGSGAPSSTAGGAGKDAAGSTATSGAATTPTSTAKSTGTGPGGAEAECRTEEAVTETAGSEVVVTLSEWAVKASGKPTAGNISFKAENTGKERHELVIVKGDSAEALPKDADGGLDEDKLPAGALIGEIEPFAAGKVCSGTFKMAAGKYVLLCNIVETEPNGEKESHFKEGMHSSFVVS